jgi:predicted RNA-binding protein with EMAP domain
MKKSKEELSRIRAEIGRRGAAQSSKTYAKRRKLKELEPQLNQWIQDVAYGRLSIDDVPEPMRDYVQSVVDILKPEIDRVQARIKEAEAVIEWRKSKGFAEDDE